MIEVFKTDVTGHYKAELLVQIIGKQFAGYRANFDLDDCDRILRISFQGNINVGEIIQLLSSYGYACDVLPDEINPQVRDRAMEFSGREL